MLRSQAMSSSGLAAARLSLQAQAHILTTLELISLSFGLVASFGQSLTLAQSHFMFFGRITDALLY
jgi:hypothetical protein